MIAVLDTSIAVKWFAPDGDAGDAVAERLLRDVVARPRRFVVPELFFYEMTAVLCRRMRQARDAYTALQRLARLGLRRIRLDDCLLRRAAHLAYDYKLSGYDACFRRPRDGPGWRLAHPRRRGPSAAGCARRLARPGVALARSHGAVLTGLFPAH